ncbi:PPOX class F420-dependent oxidoreductase [Quadrisphaera sp. KR29]|uniref:PPOX class F420-dependent oxidoreductase n=1 Tax=Quadrisphaera sp. KR29 TaxID=3461391 RepID=UPI004043E76B
MATPAGAADSAALIALSRQTYVRLTTFRRDGTPVPTPVWVVADRSALGGRDGDLLVITGARAGKVKRLRHTGRVLVVPCDQRGRPQPGAPELEALAEVVVDPAVVRRLRLLVQIKHPVLGRLMLGGQRAGAALARRRGKTPPEQVALRIHPLAPGT